MRLSRISASQIWLRYPLFRKTTTSGTQRNPSWATSRCNAAERKRHILRWRRLMTVPSATSGPSHQSQSRASGAGQALRTVRQSTVGDPSGCPVRRRRPCWWRWCGRHVQQCWGDVRWWSLCDPWGYCRSLVEPARAKMKNVWRWTILLKV